MRLGRLTYGDFLDCLTSDERLTDLAKRHDLHPTTISSLRLGRIYKPYWKRARSEGFTPKRARYPKFKEIELKYLYQSKKSDEDLSEEMNRSIIDVFKARHGLTYREFYIRENGASCLQ